MWTQFWDMHSGGNTKVKPYNKIFIEAPEEEAVTIFYNRFGRNPNCVTCTCCGEDYAISKSATLEEATAFHRGCAWDAAEKRYVEQAEHNRCKTLTEYLMEEDVLAIYAADIKPEERLGTVPEQGYVWID